MNANSLVVANNLPLARIPWIPMKTCESMRLEDSKFYKKYISNVGAEKARKNLMLYKFLDEVFPYYLPKRYHAMDVIALEEMSSSTELAEDFTSCNATNMFFISSVYNDLAWTITHHLETPEEDNRLVTPKLKAAFFQNGVPPEQCGSAAEFILEPWVLSQLLIQPAILHQWVMAVYAEGLQLHAEIAALVHLPARPELDITKSFRYILNMLDLLDICVVKGLSVLEHRSKHCFHHTTCIEFFNLVLDLLPFLKLVLSKKVSHIIRAAKRMLWNSSEEYLGGNVIQQPFAPSYKHYSIMYSFKYWHKESFDYFFIGSELEQYEKPPLAGSSDSSPGFVAWAEKIKIKFGNLAKWDEIKKFVDQKILQPGWIKGLEAKDVLKLVEGDMMFLYHYLIYIKYEGMSSSAPGVREFDSGIMETIKTLQADNELANALAAMTSRLFIVLRRKYLSADIRLQSVDCEGPDMSMKEIVSAIGLMKTKWTISKLMKLLGDQIPAETGKAAEEPCPNMDTMEVREIVSGLEIRIKKIMFGIVKTFFESYTANQTINKICNEAAFIQYVLPTFVVSFLRSTKNPEATLGDQKRHLSFVHHLVKTFEDPKGLITPLNHLCPEFAGLKKTTYDYIFRHYFQHKYYVIAIGVESGWMKSKNIEIRDELLRPYDKTERVPPLLIKSFLHFNAGLIDILARSDNGSYSIEFVELVKLGGSRITTPICETWTSWMSRYLTRIQFALQKAYHGTESTPVNHRLSMCLALCDFVIGFSDPDKWEPNNLMESLFMYAVDIVGIKGHLRLERREFSRGETECEAKKLSMQQIFAILMYHLMKINFGFPYLVLTEEEIRTIVPPFHLDKVESALYGIMLEDRWRLKQIISEWLIDADGKTDLSLATFKDVQAAPLCYEMAKQDLTDEGKVKMSSSGEITFFPIKHCRWCGLVDDGKKEMQLCQVCLQSPEYPDKNFFCSQKCEDVAMDILHREEHARCLMMKLDMID